MSDPFQHGVKYTEADAEEFRRSMASLSPQARAESEAEYSEALKNLEIMLENVLQDLRFREYAIEEVDDAITYTMLSRALATLTAMPGGRVRNSQLLAAALIKLARAPRAIVNPLAHLEKEEKPHHD